MVWVMLGVSPGVATHSGFCVKVTARARRAESPGAQGNLLFLLLRVGPPRAALGGSFLGILQWETGVDAVEEVCCSHSRATWRCWFMAMAMSQGGSVVSAGESVCSGIVVGA